MFIPIFFIFGLWHGVLGSETACQVLAERTCRMDSIPPEVLPGNLEELEVECQNLYKVKQCIKDSVKKCMDEGSGNITVDEGALIHLKENKRMIELAIEICDKDSTLNSQFVHDMACFKETTVAENKENTCTDYTKRVLNHLQSRIDLKLRTVTDSVDRQTFYKCLSVLSDFNCYVSKYENKCGYHAKETALALIQRGASLDVQCPDSIRIDMLELIDAWKSVSKKGVLIRELILSDI